MTQPQIKKYRRKVSDERVMKVTISVYGKEAAAQSNHNYTKLVRKILEADAEVIKGRVYYSADGKSFTMQIPLGNGFEKTIPWTNVNEWEAME